MEETKTAPYNMKHPLQDQEEEDDDDNRSRDSSSSSSSTTGGLHSYHHNYTGCSSSTTSLNTDLSLGLTLSSSSSRLVNYESDNRQGNTYDEEGADSSLMVKVYMEGIPIGRKLDLMTQHGYHTLFPTLSIMFNTPLFCPGVNKKGISGRKHVLTYEDSDGDWMLVGDVPWEMFLRTVKKMRITKSQTC